jgi:proline iminopeptidase
MSWAGFEIPRAGVVGWERGRGHLLTLVLHGGPGLADYTESLADEIHDGGDGRLRVVRYQQRGQQPSATDGQLTVAQLVEDAIAVLDHFGAERALITGHSWGAHLAMHIAVAHPERTAGLLLIDALGGVGDGGASTMSAVINGRLGPEVLAQIAALHESDLTLLEQGTATIQLLWPGYFSDPAKAPPAPPIEYDMAVGGAIMADATTLLAEGVLEKALPSITAPSLHQIGRHSPINPQANEDTAAAMPGALVDLLDTGHFTWIEQPGCVTAATRRLLQAI